MKRVSLIVAIVYCAVASAIAAPSDDHAKFQIQMKSGADALTKKDFAAAKRDYSEALKLAPQHPTAIYRFALANASLGNVGDALILLQRIAAMGLQLPPTFDSSFAMLKGREGIKTEIAHNTAALCDCKTIFEGPKQPFIAEGIAFDPRRNLFLVSSVYQRRIVTIADGRMHEFTKTLPDGMSPFSITLDAKRDRI